MSSLKRIDRNILSCTRVGEGYTVAYLTGKLEREHHEVTGSMMRLAGKGFFSIVPGEGAFVYVRVRERGDVRLSLYGG